MKTYDDELRVGHILRAARRIVEYSGGMTRGEFDADLKTQDASIRQLEIIGEAAKNVSPGFRAKYPQIPWRGMAGMRDMLIHQYEEADFDIVWKTITESIPEILAHLEGISSD
ncbi:MAG: DUF86 domain-containing protein [Saprospiraceae bacterium]